MKGDFVERMFILTVSGDQRMMSCASHPSAPKGQRSLPPTFEFILGLSTWARSRDRLSPAAQEATTRTFPLLRSQVLGERFVCSVLFTERACCCIAACLRCFVSDLQSNTACVEATFQAHWCPWNQLENKLDRSGSWSCVCLRII